MGIARRVSRRKCSRRSKAILAFGILWLDWTRSTRGAAAPFEGLRLFVPEGTGRRLRERALALSLAARTEIFEFRERGRPDPENGFRRRRKSRKLA